MELLSGLPLRGGLRCCIRSVNWTGLYRGVGSYEGGESDGNIGGTPLNYRYVRCSLSNPRKTCLTHRNRADFCFLVCKDNSCHAIFFPPGSESRSMLLTRAYIQVLCPGYYHLLLPSYKDLHGQRLILVLRSPSPQPP